MYRHIVVYSGLLKWSSWESVPNGTPIDVFPLCPWTISDNHSWSVHGWHSSRSIKSTKTFSHGESSRTALPCVTIDLVPSHLSDLWWHSLSFSLCCSSSQPLSISLMRWMQPWTSHTHRTLGRCCEPTSDTLSSSWSLSKMACSTTPMFSSRQSLWMESPLLQGEQVQN